MFFYKDVTARKTEPKQGNPCLLNTFKASYYWGNDNLSTKNHMQSAR